MVEIKTDSLPKAKFSTADKPRTPADFTASKTETIKFSDTNLALLESYMVGSTGNIQGNSIGGVEIRSMIEEAKNSSEKRQAILHTVLTPQDLLNGKATREQIAKARLEANEARLYVGNYQIFSPETVALGRNHVNPEENIDIVLKFPPLTDGGEIIPEWEIELRKARDNSVIVDDPEIWQKVKIRPAGKDVFGDEDPGEEDFFAISHREGKHYVRFIGLDATVREVQAR